MITRTDLYKAFHIPVTIIDINDQLLISQHSGQLQIAIVDILERISKRRDITEI